MKTTRPLYRELASLLLACNNCRKTNNVEWLEKHEESISTLISWLPSGSGIDTGTVLDKDESTPEKLVFTFAYHHMNDVGMYDGWTEHRLIVKPSLAHEIDLSITGKDRNQIKDYLYETYRDALTCGVWQTEDGKWHCSLYEKESDK